LSIVFFVTGANAYYELDLLFLNKDNGKLYSYSFLCICIYINILLLLISTMISVIKNL